MALSFDEFCSRLEQVRLDRSGRLVKPYKPLLVAAVVILIHKGKHPSRNVFLDGAGHALGGRSEAVHPSSPQGGADACLVP